MSKKIKLKSISTIHRRLYRFASQACRNNNNNTCEVCGLKTGDIYNGKKQRVEAHHILSRHIKDSPLKWDLNNMVCLCTKCHKGGLFSAHKNPVWFINWLQENKKDQYNYVLEHCNDTLDLNNRDILKSIEDKLIKE